MRLKIYFLSLNIFLLLGGLCIGKEREGIVSVSINLKDSSKTGIAKLWIPYPVSDNYQVIENITTEGNFLQSNLYREPKSGALYLFVEWEKVATQKLLELRFRVLAKEREKRNLKETDDAIPVEVKKYLESSQWIPTDGKVKEIAENLTKGKTGILQKARSVYDWVVENTQRDPNVKGCGVGVVEVTLATRTGKCADLSSVYVALARSVGVPAREVFGLRLGKKSEEEMTGGYHCWAEFYLPGKGWIPVDPSDVRKIMLAQNLKLEEVKPYREYYFGGVDEYRIILERGGRGITFSPSQESGPLNYFMYPYAEIDGKALEYFEPKRFGYSVHFKAI